MRVKFSNFLAGFILLFSLSGMATAESVKIGWTAWSDAEFVTNVAARDIEQRLGQNVELIQTHIAPQYQGLAAGDIDVMLMAWLPGTDEDYMDKVGTDIVSLGILYGYARLDWAVPSYIPEDQLSSIEDLKKDEVRSKLDRTMTGIDPGAGLTRLSQQVLEDYELDGHELQISSGAGMTAALARAVRRDDWIVVTGWSPHWKFGAYDLRYLKNTLGSFERVHAMARQGFYQDNPEAALMISRMHFDLDALQESMFYAQENSYEEAVDRFIEQNGDLIDYWVCGKL
ncbi:MAG: glycine betaine ABC transporter substrate-binding protein [Wenzhouxiangellaceae bacterium]|nr:glycine betaine ABC transporter substrate-binding protein [Wenzhouxiangellaceae bacterium]